MARIELDGVAKSWGSVVAVEPTDLDIRDGEFVAILGPSGCGKSTTLFMLAGIYQPSAGAIRFDGAEVNAVEARDRNVGVVFQSYALYPHMTVLENIVFPLRFKKVASQDAKGRAEAAARLVQVQDLLDRRPSQLSGGQQQRVALARALVKEPQLLLLDEPLSNLDASLRLAMRGEIRALQRKLGVTTILVTHDQIEATTMADRIICMSKGRIEQIGTAEDLYRRPETLFVAGFIGSPPINILTGTLAQGRFGVGEASVAVTTRRAGPAVLGVRAEHLLLGRGPHRGRVMDAEPHGREIFYQMDTPFGTMRAVEAGARPRYGVGDLVSFDIADALVFDPATGRRVTDAELIDA